MTRGISIDGASLPVTDASITFSRDIVTLPSMLDIGGEYVYNGTYNSIQGSFGGAYRPSIFATYIADMLETEPASHEIIVSDIVENTWCSADSRLTSAEISISAGELAKFNCVFACRDIASIGTALAIPDYTTTIPVFSDASLITIYGSDLSPTYSAVKSFSVKIERPYVADEFTFENTVFSTGIYQSGDLKISGVITLGQTANILSSLRAITIRLGTNTITIQYPFVTAIESNISGRSLVNKSYTWSCKRSMFAFTCE